MRKIVLAAAAVAALGLAVPTFTSTPAEARTVTVIKGTPTVTVIKKHRRHVRHFHWFKHQHMRHARVFVR
jgi:hypothetical protein